MATGAGWAATVRNRRWTGTRGLEVGRGSLAYARVQIRVQQATDVDYVYVTTGP